MHAGFCLISFITVYFVYPETAGVPLEVCIIFYPSFVTILIIFPAKEMDALFGDESNENEDDEDDDEDKDDNEDESIYSGSGTPGSSMRSGSPSARRNNSSTPLVGDGGPVSMMKRMFDNARKKDTGGKYDQVGQ